MNRKMFTKRRCLIAISIVLAVVLVPYLFSRLNSPWRQVA